MRVIIFVACVWMSPEIAVAAEPVSAPADLRVQMQEVVKILEGKNIRHRWVRDQLGELFLNQDGRDRFLLNVIAKVRGSGITDGKIRRVKWVVEQNDPEFGYAEFAVELCGRWYKIWPQCTEAVFAWRQVEDRWVLAPPESIRLDPGVKRR